MRCLVCNHAERKAIDQVLLGRNGPGVVQALADKLGMTRQVLWRHKKNHLGMNTARKVGKGGGGNLGARIEELVAEANRLQLCAEHGMDGAQFERAMKALRMRMQLVEMEAKLEGKLGESGGARVLVQNLMQAPVQTEVTAEEAERVAREYLEVCGPQALPEVGATDERD
jgi:hypothetical protein